MLVSKKISILRVDWVLLAPVLLVALAGLATMNSFVGESYFFERQSVWLSLSLVVFFAASLVDWRFLRRTGVIVVLFVVSALFLLFLFAAGSVFQGARSWFDLGGFSFQPSDPAKLTLVLLLSKYFSRRHVEIAHIRHILVSGTYALIFFLLVLLQPDFGSAIIIFLIWFGMVLVSGISKKHLLAVIASVAVASMLLWSFALAPYQKQRIITFLDPLADVRGTGYNARQSTIAVGSGELFGKGVGYGTQSKLRFLPEYETDFIFAAFAEEWGFVGSLLLLSLYGVIIWRILRAAMLGAGNFEMFFGLGLAIFFMAHIIVHVGMNIGLLPITGVTIPFMSYGGSHLVTEFLGLGILMGQRVYSRATHRDDVRESEIPGIQ
ncbi:rod shape-determining protein RodA [Patescibacteria group bacterium]|nr:MAG: rod shape-determining protein RodA [Patescibacteria group bacterium]